MSDVNMFDNGSITFGLDVVEKKDRLRANNGRHAKLTDTPQTFVPLTNINFINSTLEVLESMGAVIAPSVRNTSESRSEFVKQQISSMTSEERLDFYGVVSRRTVFSSRTVSFFLDEAGVEAYNSSLPEDAPAEDGLGKIGKAVKFQVAFEKSEIATLADRDPVAWLLANLDSIRGKMRIKLANDFPVRPEERYSFICRDNDSAEVIIEVSKNQANTIKEIVEATGKSWRGNSWSLHKTGKGLSTKLVVRSNGNAEPLDDEDEFLPVAISHNNRVFGVPLSETETRRNLVVAIVGEEVLDAQKPTWYTSI